MRENIAAESPVESDLWAEMRRRPSPGQERAFLLRSRRRPDSTA
jgi:hypothetical protein